MAHDSDRAKLMELALCSKIDLMGFVRRIKKSKAYCFPVHLYARRPLAVGVVPTDTEKTAGRIAYLCFPDIVVVLRPSGFAQIIKAVVRWISVDMINFLCGEVPIHIQPRKAMCPVGFAIDVNGNVAEPIGSSGYSANACSIAFDTNKPSEQTSFWVVLEKFVKSFLCDNRASHDAAFRKVVRSPLARLTPLGFVNYTPTEAR